MSGHIRQRPSGSWELRYRVDGKVKTATFRGTKREAAARLRQLMTSADHGMHVDRNRTTVSNHVMARLEQWQASGKISARTAENYRTLAVEIVAHLGNIPLQKLGTPDIEQWHTAMRTKGLTRTASAAHEMLARALADGVRHKMIRHNAARDQGPPPTRRAVPMPTLKAEQIPELLAKLEPEWRAPVIVAMYCGIRRGELLGLRWSRIELDQGRMQIVEALDETKTDGITVKAPKTLAGRRVISLPQVVIDVLREHRKAQLERCLLLGLGRPSADALVFPNHHGGYDGPRAFSLRWGRAAARYGFPEIRWHSLRHSHAAMLIEAGVPITTISARLGHKDPSITLKVYSRMFSKDDSAAAAAIDRALGH